MYILQIYPLFFEYILFFVWKSLEILDKQYCPVHYTKKCAPKPMSDKNTLAWICPKDWNLQKITLFQKPLNWTVAVFFKSNFVWVMYTFNRQITKSKFWNVNEMGLVQKDIQEWRPIRYERARASSSEQAWPITGTWKLRRMVNTSVGNTNFSTFIAVSSLVEAYINNFRDDREKMYETLSFKAYAVTVSCILK